MSSISTCDERRKDDERLKQVINQLQVYRHQPRNKTNVDNSINPILETQNSTSQKKKETKQQKPPTKVNPIVMSMNGNGMIELPKNSEK